MHQLCVEAQGFNAARGDLQYNEELEEGAVSGSTKGRLRDSGTLMISLAFDFCHLFDLLSE